MFERITLDDLKRRRRDRLRELDAPDTNPLRFFRMIEDGETFDAPARLRFPSRMSANHTLVLHDLADWQHTPPDLRFFAALYVEAFRKVGIPLYVGRADDCSVTVGHVVYAYELTAQEWALLAAFGRRISDKRGLGVEFRGKGEWALQGVHPSPVPLHYGPPVRKTPRGLLNDFRGRK